MPTQKQPICIKMVWPCSKWILWKFCQIKGAARNGCDDICRFIAKNLIATIQVNSFWFLVKLGLGNTNWSAFLNFFHQSTIISTTLLDFTNFLHCPFLTEPPYFCSICRLYCTYMYFIASHYIALFYIILYSFVCRWKPALFPQLLIFP